MMPGGLIAIKHHPVDLGEILRVAQRTSLVQLLALATNTDGA